MTQNTHGGTGRLPCIESGGPHFPLLGSWGYFWVVNDVTSPDLGSIPMCTSHPYPTSHAYIQHSQKNCPKIPMINSCPALPCPALSCLLILLIHHPLLPSFSHPALRPVPSYPHNRQQWLASSPTLLFAPTFTQSPHRASQTLSKSVTMHQTIGFSQPDLHPSRKNAHILPGHHHLRYDNQLVLHSVLSLTSAFTLHSKCQPLPLVVPEASLVPQESLPPHPLRFHKTTSRRSLQTRFRRHFSLPTSSFLISDPIPHTWLADYHTPFRYPFPQLF